MARKASEGIEDLIRRTTGPRIKATVTVNQPYAQDQHETMHYRHPRGGQAKYLELPMFEGFRGWLQEFADGLLDEGADTEQGWGKVGRHLQEVVKENAPREFGDLLDSAALLVKSGGSIVLDIPAKQGRLSDAELTAKDYMRHGGQGYRS